ncbi:putative sensor domain DACNV-containing protein [Fictibacillus phosphorivorans]|uniref:putative sensor domain DACNV-containing protein n=1 Tax=Fictibacillus phosphorivorans TaxID=1221500 RepID=UPI001293F189|nr:hypothetical protein [Fictibacillus phosphorivorans]MQR94777.1 hypothetical protein [Fictibacillus phosphorivorans]
MGENNYKYPGDLARTVNSYLTDISDKSMEVLPMGVLKNLFEVMYFSSLKTEESDSIRCTITYLNPDNPDPKPPKRIVKDRWSAIKFKETIDFSISNLVKLSKAADPKASSLAVYHKNEGLIIWGMIDQEHNYYNYILNESESGPERPGVFQATINDIGDISVFRGYTMIANYKQNLILDKQIDIFTTGPVSNLLDGHISNIRENVRKKVGSEIYDAWDHWDNILTDDWYIIICRLLINIQSYRHGGAILIDPNKPGKDLNIKYKIEYNRLFKLILEYGEYNVLKNYYEGLIFENYYGTEKDLPILLHNELQILNYEKDDIVAGITGSLRYISSLTCVDGLVLLDNNLKVNGFGVEITTTKQPEKIYISEDKDAAPHLLREGNYNHFGTRHRSMMRYCNQNPGSIGFVISQDGDIRAITKIDGRLIIWENIKVLYNTEN